MKRSKIDVARAVLRLAGEPLVPLSRLTDDATSEKTLERWAVRGRAGVYLDAVLRPGAGWLSSRAALKRFHDEVWGHVRRREAEAAAQLKGGAA